jgi:predicted dehydrogenase
MTIRIGVVGLGQIARKRHLPAIAAHDGFALAGLASLGGGPDVAGLPVHADHRTMLASCDLDAVAICTPPAARFAIARDALRAGKHVLLEKPIDATLERAIATVAAFEAARLKLAIVFQHRFRTASLKLAEILRAGRLGRLVSCSASVRWWRGPDYFAQAGRGMAARDGGGVLLTQAIHTLDLFLSLAGPVAELSAFHANTGLRAIDTEDVAAATLRFASGAIGTIDATTAAFPGHPERIELAGDKGGAVLEADTLRVRLMDGTTIEAGAGGGSGGGADPMAFDHAANTRLLADFLDAIDEDRAPATDGRAALAVHRLIAAILASGGRPIVP